MAAQPDPDRPQIDGERPEPDAPEQVIDLPGLLSDEFGISRSAARQEIALGTVEIDGEKIVEDKFSFPRSKIEGKEITIVGEVRHFKLTYAPKE